MTITVSEQDSVAEQISQLLDQSCSEIDFISVTTVQAGEQLTLNYEVNMKSNIDDFALANLLISKIENCDVALTKKAKKERIYNGIQQRRTKNEGYTNPGQGHGRRRNWLNTCILIERSKI